jgi:hypothetical protein
VKSFLCIQKYNKNVLPYFREKPLSFLCIQKYNKNVLPYFREKPLSMYVFSNDKVVKEKFRNSTSSGSLLFNDTMMQAGGI